MHYLIINASKKYLSRGKKYKEKLLAKKKHALLANFSLVLGAIIWGSTFFLIKDTVNNINPIVLNAYRGLISVFVLGVCVLFCKNKKIFTNFKEGALLGFLLFIGYTAQSIGIKHTTALNAGFLSNLFLFFIPFYNFIFWRKKLNLANFIAIILAISGLWLITGGMHGFSFGDFLNLICAATWGFYLILTDKFVKKSFAPLILNFQQWLVITALSLITILAFHLHLDIPSLATTGALVYLATFASVIAYELDFVAQRYTAPLSVAIILLLEPVFSAIFAWTLGNEIFNWVKFSGGVLILLAIIASEMPMLNTKPKIK